MVDFTPKEALKHRFERKIHLWIFLGMYVPYLASSIWDELHTGVLHSTAGWLYLIVTPLTLVGGAVWLSPYPWQVGEKNGARFWVNALVAALCAQIYVLLALVLDYGLRRAAGAETDLPGTIRSHATFHAPLMTMVGGVIALRERLALENEQIRAAAREAQSRALQGQLNPHVLFNALNGLAELVQKSPGDAEMSIRHLSDLLRKVLAASEQDLARLSEEKALLEDYLDMEGLRLGNRLQLAWDWDPEVNRVWMPPLLLQPLVENAIKHGIAPSKSGGILKICAEKQGDDLLLTVRNTGQAMKPNTTYEGVGIRNLRARLGLCFGAGATFSIGPEEEWTVAQIRVRESSWRGEVA
jgi:hypothetical protein